jgi:hypothetical protein
MCLHFALGDKSVCAQLLILNLADLLRMLRILALRRTNESSHTPRHLDPRIRVEEEMRIHRDPVGAI